MSIDIYLILTITTINLYKHEKINTTTRCTYRCTFKCTQQKHLDGFTHHHTASPQLFALFWIRQSTFFLDGFLSSGLLPKIPKSPDHLSDCLLRSFLTGKAMGIDLKLYYILTPIRKAWKDMSTIFILHKNEKNKNSIRNFQYLTGSFVTSQSGWNFSNLTFSNRLRPRVKVWTYLPKLICHHPWR